MKIFPDYKSRPRIEVPSSPLKNSLEAVSILCLIVQWGYLAVHWTTLPERIPTHFGIDGKPDGWAGTGSVIILPIVGLIQYGALTILNRFPHIFNFPVEVTPQNAPFLYQTGTTFVSLIKAEILLMLAYITIRIVDTALGKATGLDWFFLPTLFIILLGSIATYLIYIYRSPRTRTG